MSPELSFAVALPPDVAAPPPAARGGGVRWPDGVYRAPGECPDEGVGHEASDIGTQRSEPHRLTPPNRARVALPAALALAAAALAALALARRRRRR
jgi:hypothetical protein